MYSKTVKSIVSIFYPFWGLFIGLTKRNYSPSTISIYLFSILAAISLYPTESSDIGSYTIAYKNLGMPNAPMPKLDILSSFLFEMLSSLGLEFIFYYIVLSILTAFFCDMSIRLVNKLDQSPSDSILISLLMFLTFILINPIVITLNSRFHLTLLAINYALLLYLNGRWLRSLSIAFFSGLIHFFGFFVFALFLFLPILKKININYLFALTLFSVFLPLNIQFYIDFFNFIRLDDIATKLSFYNQVADIKPSIQKSWHLVIFQPLAFYALLALFFYNFQANRRVIVEHKKYLYTAAKVSVIFLCLTILTMSVLPEATSRLQRVSILVLTLWHLLFYRTVKKPTLSNSLILFLPMSFYAIVIWRRLLDQYSIALFLPAPFTYFDNLPIVTAFLGFID
jgi:hypothetical protein